MVASSLFKTITAAAFLVGTVLAQDPGEGFIFKCTRPGVVALTFDDGPGNFTDELLGYLDTAQIKATFYVVGDNIVGPYGAGLLKEYQKGHQIAYHTYTHSNLNLLTPALVTTEMTKSMALVKEKLGVEPIYMRPPFGNCNAACAAIMKKLGLLVTQWNLDSNDWTYDAKLAQGLYDNVMKGITPSNPTIDNFIILMHEIHGFSVKFVPKIIEQIKAKGFTFDTVAGCLGGTPPPYKEGWGITYNSANASAAGGSSLPPASSAAATSAAPSVSGPSVASASVVGPTAALSAGGPAPNGTGAPVVAKSGAATLGGNSVFAVVLAGLSAIAYVLTL